MKTNIPLNQVDHLRSLNMGKEKFYHLLIKMAEKLSILPKMLKLKVSKATLSRVFREIGISHRKMLVKPMLTHLHENRRVDWALSRCDPSFDWSRWIFSDEKKFNLDGPDGYRYYWKLEGMDQKIYSRDSNFRSSVMVWVEFPKMDVHLWCRFQKR